jgi:hypothetical protein
MPNTSVVNVSRVINEGRWGLRAEMTMGKYIFKLSFPFSISIFFHFLPFSHLPHYSEFESVVKKSGFLSQRAKVLGFRL